MAGAIHARPSPCAVARAFEEVACVQRAVIASPQVVARAGAVGAGAVPGARVEARKDAAAVAGVTVLTRALSFKARAMPSAVVVT